MHILEPRGRPRAVVLVAHGLNQHAFGLRSLYEPLVERGAAIVVLEFRGHLREPGERAADVRETWRRVTSRDWGEDWHEAVAAAAALAAPHQAPLAFLGYSLGALVHAHQLATTSAVPGTFARQVLLAPAIRVHSRTRAVRLFRLFGPRFLVPSLAPANLRSHTATSVSAYEALFALEAAMDRLPHAHRLRIPTTVVSDPGDELVSADRLKVWARRHDLSGTWRFESIEKDRATAGSRLRHYITDPFGLGVASFRRLEQLVSERLHI